MTRRPLSRVDAMIMGAAAALQIAPSLPTALPSLALADRGSIQAVGMGVAASCRALDGVLAIR